jgi:hypothetical protein
MGVSLVHKFEDYGAWRRNVAERIDEYRRWLHQHDLADAQIELRLGQIIERLAEDRLTIAFVAEFSRGKSELINAIFFADYGRRLLPTSAGRTTMCPTELKWDADEAPSLKLLPIETRANNATISEFKRFPDEWMRFPLDVSAADALAATLQRIRETKLVPLEEARAYGLFLPGAIDQPARIRQGDMVEVPRWRHAVINFPHPLLAHGLVILDTPGLNAIGTEPELTLDLLPNAHAVLFVLALDTGVSRSDVQMWRDYIQPASGRELCRFAVLNKIDTLWDGLRTDEEIEAEVLQQVAYCSSMLDLDAGSIFPVSAQRALLAKIQGDEPMLNRSRLPWLEQALSMHLIPRRREIVRYNTRSELAELFSQSRSLVETRLKGVEDQRTELVSLRGKNMNVVGQMVDRARSEKSRFERGLAKFQAVRSVYSQHANQIFTLLGIDALNEDGKRTLIEVRASRFTPEVRAALNGYLERCRSRLDRAGQQIGEVQQMMQAIYRRFEDDQGLKLGMPPSFSLLRYQKELQRLEGMYQTHFDTLFAMLTNEAMTLLQKFFETIVSQIRRVFMYANRESEQWLRALIAPIEVQIRERQVQLKRRLESIKRVHDATDALEERIRELEQAAARFRGQIESIERMSEELDQKLTEESEPIAVAA